MLGQERLELVLDAFDHGLVLAGEVLQLVADGLIGFRINVLEGQILQLLAHVLHAHAAGERRIDFHRLLGNSPALVGAHVIERAHVVQPVCELDQKHAHVIGHGKKQLAQVFGLLRLAGDEVETLDLGKALDQRADLVAKELVDLVTRRGGVLDRVMQQRDRDRRLVHVQVGQDRRDFERVGDIGVTAGALLTPMLLHGVDIGLVEQRDIGVRLIFLYPLNEFVLPHHGSVTGPIMGALRTLRSAEMESGRGVRPQPAISVVVAFFRRNQAFNAGAKLFFRHLVEGDGVRHVRTIRGLGGVLVGRSAGRAVGLGFIDFDMALKRMDQVFLQIVGRKGFVGDLAKGHDRVLIIVAVDGDLGALGDETRTVSCEQNEIEPVVDFVDTVFNCDTSH